MEINDGLLLAASLVNLHCLSNVNVGRANDEIVEGHDGEFDLISLLKVWQVNIGSELLRHQ